MVIKVDPTLANALDKARCQALALRSRASEDLLASSLPCRRRSRAWPAPWLRRAKQARETPPPPSAAPSAYENFRKIVLDPLELIQVAEMASVKTIPGRPGQHDRDGLQRAWSRRSKRSSACPPPAMAAPVAAGAAAAAAAEEKTEFNVVLAEAGANEGRRHQGRA